MANKNFKKALADKKPMTPSRVAIPQIDPSGISTPQVQASEIAKPDPKPKAVASPKKEAKSDSEKVRNYATYISDRQKKQIKLRAIEEECNDQTIVQRALEEYFKNHPL